MRHAHSLPFCYLCGNVFDPTDEANDDHVPPSGIFSEADRDFPLILRTHQDCNTARSQDDQVAGQLVGVLHGRKVNPTHKKLKVKLGHFENGSRAVVVGNLDIRAIIRRWVRGFHAALYKEYLPEADSFMTCPPLPEAKPTADGPQFMPVQEVFPLFVKELKRNRATATLDRIVCRNGKCRYECVWTQADNGTWMCVYGLDLYNWIDLGDKNFEPRGCVGTYIRPSGGVPSGASRSTRLEFPVATGGRLDPFGG